MFSLTEAEATALKSGLGLGFFFPRLEGWRRKGMSRSFDCVLGGGLDGVRLLGKRSSEKLDYL